MDVHVICPICKDGFFTTDERLRHGRGTYCSNPCKNKAKTAQIPRNCLVCNTPFTVNQSRIDRGFGKFCSKSCMYIGITKTAEHKKQVKKQGQKEWRKNKATQNFKEKRAARDAKYKKEHPEKVNEHSKRVRAKRKGVTVRDFTAQEWREVQEAYNHHCAYCGQVFDNLTMDHVIPLSKGGWHTKNNIVPACKSCNSRKGIKELPILYVKQVHKPIQLTLL